MHSATCLNASKVIQIQRASALGEKMKSQVVVSFLLAFIALGQMQVLGQRSGGEQTSFAVEEIPGEPRVKRPIPVPDAAVEALRTDEGVTSCLRDNPLAPEQSLSSWFVASAIHLDGAKEADVVVVPSFRGQESMCFQTPAGIGLFWVFRENGGRYELVLRTWGGGLEILTARTNGYRDVRTGTLGQAGRDLTNTTFHFDGIRYVADRKTTQK
jgi:hypothetical protein